jgi:hypothetical protein
MKKLWWIILLLLVAYFVWRSWRRDGAMAPADRGQSVVFNRMWVDHLPASETDRLQIFAAVTDEPLGIFDARSAWTGQWEQFRYEPRGDGQLELFYPQSKTKQRVSYRAWKCNEQRDFDYCLELTGTKGARKYYSQRGWEIGTLDGARGLERRLGDGRAAR